jgi:S1-C subfamily serine protease
VRLGTSSLGVVLCALSALAGWSARGRPAAATPEPPVVTPAPVPAAADPRKDPSASDIAERALAFTASIEGRARGKAVYGAGVVLDTGGHVLTCWHVAQGLAAPQVHFSDGERLSATVVDHDASLDLALLKLVTPRRVSAPLGSVVGLRAGEDVFALGTPRKMRFSLSRGLLSYVGRNFDGVRYLQTDLPMNGGSSGGPLLDEQGAVIGIASFVLRDTQGLAFALPIDYALGRFAGALGRSTDQPAFERWLSSRGPSAEQPRPEDP